MIGGSRGSPTISDTYYHQRLSDWTDRGVAAGEFEGEEDRDFDNPIYGTEADENVYSESPRANLHSPFVTYDTVADCQ